MSGFGLPALGTKLVCCSQVSRLLNTRNVHLADSDALQSNINSFANIRRTGAKNSSGVSERYLQQLGRPCRAELPKLWRSNGEAADVGDGVLSIHSNHSVASKFSIVQECVRHPQA